MTDIRQVINHLTLETVRRHLPIWTDWGVHDTGHLVHSLGCTSLTHLGNEQGWVSVSEVPAPKSGAYGHVDEDVRSDSVWFDRDSHQPRLIAEFERYSGKVKDLKPKVESLLLAQHRWGNPDALLVLAYWSVGLVTLPDHQSLRKIITEGFRTSGSIQVDGSTRASIVFVHFVTQMQLDGKLTLNQVLIRGEA